VISLSNDHAEVVVTKTFGKEDSLLSDIFGLVKVLATQINALLKAIIVVV